MALERGETALAEVSKKKAEQIETEEYGMIFFFPYSNIISIHVSFKFDYLVFEV